MPLLPLARAGGALTAAVILALLAPFASNGASAEVDDAPAMAQTIAAQQALDVAQQVMAGTSTELSASLALRELALRRTDLTGDDRLAADALLARPNGGATGRDVPTAVWDGAEAAKSVSGGGCSATVPLCVHWTNQGNDAPPAADGNSNQVPDWVEETIEEMETVWDYEINTLGYRAPLTDERASIDNDGVNFDVYLSDIGTRGLYGYCTVDDSRTKPAANYKYGDFASYCVLDNDFSRSEFPTNSPRENLQVTAAHEFFHAVQFAYDALEDIWFMEGSAAWIEEQVFDDVNDNRQYLSSSQFRQPTAPLDASRGLGVYGGWGFLQYLSERFGTDVIRKAWERADYSPGGPDNYSIQAIDKVMSKQTNFGDVMGTFGLAINEPKAFLSEGTRFPSATEERFMLGRVGASTGWQSYSLDHMSYAPVEVRPGGSVKESSRLKVLIDAPGRRTAPEARVMVVRKNGTSGAIQAVRLNRKGNGSVSVPFNPGSVRHVVVALGNTSTDFRRCYSNRTRYSCGGGVPLHDNAKHWFKAIVR